MSLSKLTLLTPFMACIAQPSAAVPRSPFSLPPVAVQKALKADPIAVDCLAQKERWLSEVQTLSVVGRIESADTRHLLMREMGGNVQLLSPSEQWAGRNLQLDKLNSDHAIVTAVIQPTACSEPLWRHTYYFPSPITIGKGDD